MAKWSIGLAAISSVFILISIIQSTLYKSPQELKGLLLEVQKLKTEIQGIRTSLEKKDSTKIVLIYDTVYLKK